MNELNWTTIVLMMATFFVTATGALFAVITAYSNKLGAVRKELEEFKRDKAKDDAIRDAREQRLHERIDALNETLQRVISPKGLAVIDNDLQISN